MVFLPDKRYYYTSKDLETLFRIIREHNPRDYLIFTILFHCGRRVTELIGNPKRGMMGLRPVDIDWNAGIITWTLEKRGEYETIPNEFTPKGNPRKHLIKRDRDKQRIDAEWLELLRSYIATAKIGEFDRVFPISRQYVGKMLRRYISIADLGEKKRVVHGLRHSFAVQSMNYMKTTEDLRTLQKILGHKSIQTTEEYMKYKEVNELDLMKKVKDGLKI